MPQNPTQNGMILKMKLSLQVVQFAGLHNIPELENLWL